MGDIFEEIISIDKDATTKQNLAKENLKKLQESLEQEISNLCKNILEGAKHEVAEYEKNLIQQKDLTANLINEQTKKECLLIKNAFLNVKDKIVSNLFNDLISERS
ncbi:hypothetical protein AN641_07995 [Candidatus Epulonipiscioides gigas]|nr:hypothetical protein AN641_07995 [Epulopiscium sp. SCG-C07WGA-EpuloA2]